MSHHVATMPLGPFEGQRIRGFTTRTGKRSFHLQDSCARLRRSSPTSVSEPLSRQLLERLCDSCFTYPAVAPRGSALYEFVTATFSPHFDYDLDRFTVEDIEERVAEHDGIDQETAERLLCTDFSVSDDVGEQIYGAREYRDRLLQLWYDCADSLSNCAEVLSRYPWLSSWAAPSMVAKEEGFKLVVERLRPLLPPFALLANAVIETDPTEEVLQQFAIDARLAAIGSLDERHRFLTSIWRSWSYSLETNLERPRGSHYTVWWEIDRQFGKKRKGRAAVEEAIDDCITQWSSTLSIMVAADDAALAAWVVIRVPRPPKDDRRSRHHVTSWQLAVAAIYGVAHHWSTRTVLLNAPASVAERLVQEHPDLNPTAIDSSHVGHSPEPRKILEEWMSAAGVCTPIGPLPGMLDDSTLDERRSLTVGDIEALKLVCESTERLLTMSISGTEVLQLDEAADRCAKGWEGFVIMRMSAPPKSLVAPLLEAEPGQGDSKSRRLYSAYSLNADETAEQFVATVREDRFTNHDPARCLTAYAVARTVPDLRVLGADDERGPVSWRVWEALLADESLDLEPFRAKKRYGELNLVLPIGILNTVQVYTGRYSGQKHHGMSCQHISGRRIGLAADADLLTVSELLNTSQYDWCHRCGGYSVRRMSSDQYHYYKAALEMYKCAEKIHRSASDGRTDRFTTESLEKVITRLDDLGSGKITSKTRPGGDWHWEWDEIRHKLMRRAENLRDQQGAD